jgi:tRNA(fMet)-specific endonuclease VapC
VDGYLLETSAVSALLDAGHPKHTAATDAIGGLTPAAPKYVSVIALAELTFGRLLFEATTGAPSPALLRIIEHTRVYASLDITRHTAAEYAQLKTLLATTYLAKALRSDRRPRWLENWVDKATGQALQVDENDLWMCAQARERDLVLITADAKMERISKADPLVRLQII